MKLGWRRRRWGRRSVVWLVDVVRGRTGHGELLAAPGSPPPCWPRGFLPVGGDLAQLGPDLPPAQLGRAPVLLGSVKLRVAQCRQTESWSRGLPGSAGNLWCLLGAGEEVGEVAGAELGQSGGEDWDDVGQ